MKSIAKGLKTKNMVISTLVSYLTLLFCRGPGIPSNSFQIRQVEGSIKSIAMALAHGLEKYIGHDFGGIVAFFLQQC